MNCTYFVTNQIDSTRFVLIRAAGGGAEVPRVAGGAVRQTGARGADRPGAGDGRPAAAWCLPNRLSVCVCWVCCERVVVWEGLMQCVQTFSSRQVVDQMGVI